MRGYCCRYSPYLDAGTRAMDNEGYDLIVLDEINVAVDFGLLKIGDNMDILHKKSLELYLILTGWQAAVLVTDMNNVERPFNGGVKAQKGIGY